MVSRQTGSKDLLLKLRVKRLLWAMGFFSPMEVNLSQYEYGQKSLKRFDITDLDVLAFKFEADLTPRVVIADCKSGAESSPNRILWLRGVMDFFGANDGYFVKPTINTQARSVAARVNVKTLDDASFADLESKLGVKQMKISLVDDVKFERLASLWGIDAVPAGSKPSADQISLKKVYNFLQYQYWVADERSNVLNLLDRFQGISKLLDLSNERHVLLVFTGLLQLTLSLLRLCSEILARNAADIPNQIRQYVFGGSMQLRQREQFVELIAKVSSQQVSLEPEYFPELFELVRKMLDYPQHTRMCARYLEAFLLEVKFGARKEIREVFAASYSTEALVLSKSIVVFFLKSTGVPSKFAEEFMAL